jgi:hypothetical protein
VCQPFAMAFEYHCESYWPTTTNARGAPVDAPAVSRWLCQMGAAGWELVTVTQSGDGAKPTEMLYYFRRGSG